MGKPPLLVRTLLAKLKVSHNCDRLLQRHIALLEELNKAHSCEHPGTETDRLFESTYLHTHQDSIACSDCIDAVGICTQSCEWLGCNVSHTIQRKRFQVDTKSVPLPQIYFGCYGSANTVLQSGLDRDELAKEHHLIAFEMEGAGVWDIFPTIIVKSACDYADSHKHKNWQGYAAATAATVMKALLETLELPDHETSEDNPVLVPSPQLTLEGRDLVGRSDKKPIRMIPFTRDKDFTGRKEIVQKLLDGIENQVPTYQLRAGLVGMGGVGKSQIAIEFAYRLREVKPRHSIFWIHASTGARFVQEYQELAILVNISIPEQSTILDTVFRWLSDEDNGPWCLILDNVDDDTVFIQKRDDGKVLRDYLPTASHGSVIVTSRYKPAARNLVENNLIHEIEPMSTEESLALLGTRLSFDHSNGAAASELVETLGYLPLAIVHAGSYIQMRQPSITLSRYLRLLRKEHNQVRLLDASGLVDTRRDSSSNRTVTTTWHISFEFIKKAYPQAAELFSLLSMFDNQDISQELIRREDSREKSNRSDSEQSTDDDFDLEFEDNVAVLVNYSLLSVKSDGTSYKIHRIVQLSMVQWLKDHEQLSGYQSVSLRILAGLFPSGVYTTWAACQRLLPHARKILTYEFDEWLSEEKLMLMSKVGVYLDEAGAFYEAEKVLKTASGLAKARLGADHLTTLRITTNYAVVLHNMSRGTEAEGLMRATAAKYLDLQIENNESLRTQYLLGCVLLRQGKVEEATTLVQQCFQRSIEVLGSEHHTTVDLMVCLGCIAEERGEYEEAESFYRRAISHELAASGPLHVRIFGDRTAIGRVLMLQEKLEDAEMLLKDLLAADILDENHYQALAYQSVLAVVFMKQRRFEEAQVLLQKLLTEQRKTGIDVTGHRKTTSWLCNALEAQDKWEEALVLRLEVAENWSNYTEPMTK